MIAIGPIRFDVEYNARDFVKWLNDYHGMTDDEIKVLPDSDIQELYDEWAPGYYREPTEPDGECFRGGEAAAYLAESQARIQRELK